MAEPTARGHRALAPGARRSQVTAGFVALLCAAGGCSNSEASPATATSASNDAAPQAVDAGAPPMTAADAAAAPGVGPDPCDGNNERDVFYALGTAVFPSLGCRAFANAEATGGVRSSDPAAPIWINPVDGAILDPSNWVVFRWSAGRVTTDAGQGPTDAAQQAMDAAATPEHAATADGDATDDGAADGGAAGGGVADGGVADGSGTEVGYVVEFRTRNGELFRVLLEDTQWPVDVAGWALLKGAGGPITATVVRVPLAAGTVDPSRPVLASTPITFTFAM